MSTRRNEMFLELFSVISFIAILVATVIFECAVKKKGEPIQEVSNQGKKSSTNVNNNISSNSNCNNVDDTNNNNDDVDRITKSQRAKFQAELDAAISAEKKVKNNKESTDNQQMTSSPNHDGGLDGLPPISMKKAISEGRTKVEVLRPVIYTITHDDNKKESPATLPAKTPHTKSAPERKSPGKLIESNKILKRKVQSK